MFTKNVNSVVYRFKEFYFSVLEECCGQGYIKVIPWQVTSYNCTNKLTAHYVSKNQALIS